MTTLNPTRAALLELQEERHAMREGHVFLDEKCLLLAGEMLRQLQQHARLQARLNEANEAALRALHAAVARHGLQGLQVQPPGSLEGAQVQVQASSLMGVRLQEARWVAAAAPATPAATTATPGPTGLPATASLAAPPNVADSPEARACRRAFAALAEAAVPLAAVGGNLERLSQEYRRSVRRARALQDVLLPALERDVTEVGSRIEELEQQDAIAMRRPGQQQVQEGA